MLEEHGCQPFLRGTAGYYVPLSVNAADLTGDGTQDFLLGGRLYLSQSSTSDSDGGNEHPPHQLHDAFDSPVGGESFFLTLGTTTILATVQDEGLQLRRWQHGKLQKVATLRLKTDLAKNRPFSVLPLNGSLFPTTDDGFIAIGNDRIDFYRLHDDFDLTQVISFNVTQLGEVHLGGKGNFTEGNAEDIWFSEPRWRNDRDETVGRISLLSAKTFGALDRNPDRKPVGDISTFASTVIYGNARYTDYDGIGTSLSPRAGRILGNKRPDLTFSGHRHMNQAGVIFVMPGDLVTENGEIDVAHPDIVKIVGRPVSQLAPPFQHLDLEDIDNDGHDELVVAADNDLCAGFAAGSIHVLSGSKIDTLWRALRNAPDASPRVS